MSVWLTKDEAHKLVIETAATSPAKKRKVGAVLVRLNPNDTLYCYELIGVGFNYNPNKEECEDPVTGETLPEVIHAEVACLRNPTSLVMKHVTEKPHEYLMLVTHYPCTECVGELLKYNLQDRFKVVGEFLKFDTHKPRMSLVPTSLVRGVAAVMTYGAKKYKTNNWRKVDNLERYINALERHIADWKDGIDNDPESGLHHLEHAACNIAFLLELKHLPKVEEK